MSAQSCGACKWLDVAVQPLNPRAMYPCKSPVPHSVVGPDWDVEPMFPTEGTTCPCYAPRATPPASDPQRPTEPGFMPEWSHE